MGILASIFGASSSSAADQDPVYSWLTLPVFGGGRTTSGVHITAYNAMAVPAVYSAIGIISDALAQLPLTVLRRTERGSEEAREHPLYQVLKTRPNRRQNSFTFRKQVQSHVLGWGNGYAEIQRNGRGQTVGLWPLLPDRTQAELRDDGSGSVVVRTTIRNRQVELPQEDVVHIMGYSHDGVVGLSPIDLARESIGLAKATQEFGSRFFGAGGQSGGLLSLPPGASQDALRNVKKVFREQQKFEESHLVKVLPDGVTYKETTIPPDNAQFLQTRGFQVEEIARLYRVPLHMMQSHAKSTSWGSGLEQMFIAFIQTTLQPWLQPWEQELNWKLFTEEERAAGYYVKFNLAALLRGDATARAAFYESAIHAGWMKRSEARELEDMNKIDGIDDQPVPDMRSPVIPLQRPEKPQPAEDDEEDED